MFIPFEIGELTPFETAGLILGVVLAMAIGLALGMLLARVADRCRVHRLVKYLVRELNKVYFCSYSLWEVFSHSFFPRYRKFVDWGLCAPVAAMSMIALKDNPTARCVYALANEERKGHCWCEFRYCGIWYVIDTCWHEPFILTRQDHYREHKPQIVKIWSHQEFWQWNASQQIHQKMSHPESSWLLAELAYFYGYGYGKEKRFLFHPDIAEVKFDDQIGYRINPYLFIGFPKAVFSRRIMHEMMRKPTRKRPSAHLVRKTHGQIRRFRKVFEEQRKQGVIT